MPIEKVFVYGTLRRGYQLHEHLLEPRSRYLGPGKIRGRLYDLGEYPGALPADGPGDVVAGEVYELTDPESQLRVLDELEEFDPSKPEESLFVRRTTDVVLDSGRKVQAWTYFLPRQPPRARRIPSGDYAHRRRVS
jgi:gamma-glutamylcyclotransferase (GGCT)/AIG2-like uncharacterized protein YtfP